VGVHRSRYELERVLGRYGASDFALVEADANASIQFALEGRYVQLALPLPDPNAAHFTHTPSGRPRTVTAQERAYEQALREHWRALLLAVRGKLQSIESGISTFEDEFAGFLVPHFHEQKSARRKKPKAVNWLLGSSHSVAIALVAAFLVPASAVGAFALPPSVVDHLAAPFRGALPDELAVPSEHARAVALGQSNWIRDETESLAAERDLAASAPEGDATKPGSSGGSEDVPAAEVGGLRQGAQAPGGGDTQGGQSSGAPGGSGAPAGEGGGSSSGGGDSPSSGGGGDAAAPPDGGAAPDGETSGAEESQPATGDSAQPSDGSETSESGTDSSGSGSDTTTSDPDTDTDPETDPGDSGDSGDPGDPGDSGDGHDNGNHNGDDNGNHNGDDNGNHNGADNGNHNGADNGNHNGADNGNHNGDDNGKKADAPGGDETKPGKGGPKAGP
jgi:hypothetical protein